MAASSAVNSSVSCGGAPDEDGPWRRAPPGASEGQHSCAPTSSVGRGRVRWWALPPMELASAPTPGGLRAVGNACYQRSSPTFGKARSRAWRGLPAGGLTSASCTVRVTSTLASSRVLDAEHPQRPTGGFACS
nr:unnamed protein product [Digitaria exilis]